MNQLTTTQHELDNFETEAQADAGFQAMLKFRKGKYICEDEEVPIGTQYIAHCRAWAKTWVHFIDKKVVERKVYRVINGEHAPERDELPDNDQSKWPVLNGKPQDPWVHQYLIPFESQETGDVQIFVAQSFGGRRAVGELCTAWVKRVKREPKAGQPIITLETAIMPTKNWGDVDRPKFEIVGWDDTGLTPKEVNAEKLTLAADMNDEIPF